MRPIAIDAVAWPVGLSVGRSPCNDREPCKKGWTDRDAVWDADWSWPKELRIDGVQIHPAGRGAFEGRTVPNGPDVGISCMLSTSVMTGWPQKKSSVTLNFPNEKSSPAMRPVIKIIWPFVIRDHYFNGFFKTTIAVAGRKLRTTIQDFKIVISFISPRRGSKVNKNEQEKLI